MSGMSTELSFTKGQDKSKLELNAFSFDINEESIEVKVQKVLINPEKYESIELIQIKFDCVKAILKVCGSEAKEFIWMPNIHEGRTKASDLIEILNLMPKLESFTCYIDEEVSEIEEVKVKLNLPNLKALHMWTNKSIYKLFNKILPDNSITEHSSTSPSLIGCNENFFGEFASKQKSIKKFATDQKLAMKSAKVLELEDLDYMLTEDIAEVLRSQQKLKTLCIKVSNLESFIDEICKLSQLETLKLDDATCTAADAKKLKNFKTLKVLEFKSFAYLNFWENFLDEKLLNLQKLTISSDNFESTAEMFENLPNLVYLKIDQTIQKFNTFAKFLPKLEELHLRYDDENFNFCELDTGIVKKSLKKVHIEMQWLERVEEVLEIFEICPNLEELKLDSENDLERNEGNNLNAKDFINKNFLERLNEVKSLKSLSLSEIWLKDFPNFYPQLAEELKKLSTNLKFIEIKFANWFDEGENRFGYEPLIEMLKDDFEVDQDERNFEHGIEIEIDC